LVQRIPIIFITEDSLQLFLSLVQAIKLRRCCASQAIGIRLAVDYWNVCF
jgi:hypothetical protein